MDQVLPSNLLHLETHSYVGESTADSTLWTQPPESSRSTTYSYGTHQEEKSGANWLVSAPH